MDPYTDLYLIVRFLIGALKRFGMEMELELDPSLPKRMKEDGPVYGSVYGPVSDRDPLERNSGSIRLRIYSTSQWRTTLNAAGRPSRLPRPIEPDHPYTDPYMNLHTDPYVIRI